MAQEHDDRQLVELGVFHTEMEAQLLVNRLQEHGIEARTFSTASEGIGFLSDTTFPHGGAQVAVPEGELERAKEILADFQNEKGEDEDGGGTTGATI